MYRTSAEISGRMVWSADSQGGVTMLRTPFTAVTGVAEKDGLGDAGWRSFIPKIADG